MHGLLDSIVREQTGNRSLIVFDSGDEITVQAGEQIAWNGDSGDAYGNPHLHFEVHPDDGADGLSGGCTVSSGPSSSATWLLVLVVLLRSWRRRRPSGRARD